MSPPSTIAIPIIGIETESGNPGFPGTTYGEIWKCFMMTADQDTIYQYVDGQDLLNATLTQRMQLLQKLEQLVKSAQETHSTRDVAGFPVIRAQSLLFELSAIGEQIDTLIWEVNSYAERCNQPRVQVIERNVQ